MPSRLMVSAPFIAPKRRDTFIKRHGLRRSPSLSKVTSFISLFICYDIRENPGQGLFHWPRNYPDKRFHNKTRRRANRLPSRPVPCVVHHFHTSPSTILLHYPTYHKDPTHWVSSDPPVLSCYDYLGC